MDYALLGKTGVSVSRLCLGTGRFGVAPAEEDAIRLVHQALDHGINFFDTANSYGNFARFDRPGSPPASERSSSEQILGKALKHRRDDVVISTKVREPVGPGINEQGLSRRHIMQQVERSLRALETDYIDVYHMHGADADTPLEQTMTAFDDLVRSGKIRYIGFSNFSAWRLTLGMGISEQGALSLPVVHQVGYNLVSRNVEADIIPATEYFGLGMTAWGALNGGLLASLGILQRWNPTRRPVIEAEPDASSFPPEQLEAATKLEALAREWAQVPARLALAWLLARRPIVSAIIGPETGEELEADVPAADVRLNPEQLTTLDQLNPPPPGWESQYFAAMAAATRLARQSATSSR